jgi:hypothetical protein
MSHDLMDVAFIRDAVTVAAISAEVRANGSLLICNGCGDVEALIAGILVIDDAEEAWMLCGPCVRKLPIEGMVV